MYSLLSPKLKTLKFVKRYLALIIVGLGLLSISLILIYRRVNPNESDNYLSADTLIAEKVNPSPSPEPSKTASANKKTKSPTASKTSSEVLNSSESSGISNNSGGSTTDEPGSGSNPSDESTPTAPEALPPNEIPSAFVAFYSDNQSDTDEEDLRHQNIVNRIMNSGTSTVFHAGDLMEDGTQDSLDRFNTIAGTMLTSKVFYGALGNNDRVLGDVSTPSSLYLANFNYPGNERWYSVNIGNLHMVVLDSAFASGSAEQLSWLQNDLQSAESQNRITGVMFHHPSFSTIIQPYLNDNKVDFVVNGHTHTYAKTSSGGIYYFTLPGGASLGYATVSVYLNQAEVIIYNQNGGVIDSQAVANR